PVAPSNGPATSSNSHAISFLPDWNAWNFQARAEHRVIRRHIERAPIVIAPRDVGRMATRDEQPPEQFSAGIDDVHATRSGAIDVSLAVALHAVGDAGFAAGQLMEQAAVGHAAVGRNVERGDMRHPRIVHIKYSFVGAEAQPVGIDGVLHGELYLAARGEPEHRLNVEMALQVLANHPRNNEAAGGVGPIDGTVRPHDDVVRTVEFLALPARRNGGE